MGVNVNNAEAIREALLSIDIALRKRILSKALKLISNPIIKSAESKVWTHQRTGRLYRSLTQKVTTKGNDILIVMGASKAGRNKGSHAHFLENGTAQRSYTTKNGVIHRTGRTSGINYWSNSIDETQKNSEDEFTGYIIQSMEIELNKITK